MCINMYLVISFIISFDAVKSANILVISPAPMVSHQIALRGLWIELAQRGHNVTFITTTPLKDPYLTNMNIIDVGFVNITVTEEFLLTISESNMWTVWGFFYELANKVHNLLLANDKIQDLIHNPGTYKFNVIITEVWFPELQAITKIYNCPSIFFSTIMDVHIGSHYNMANSINPISNPDLNVPYVENLNFQERTISFMHTLWELYRHQFVYSPLKQQLIDRYFGKYINVTVQELQRDADLVIINANPILSNIRAVGPTTIFVGGGNHLSPFKPLPEDLKVYLDEAKKGFIYLSLGTNVRSNDLDESTLKTLVDVFDKLPYKVLWKFESDNLPKKSKNVKIVKWAPQQDVLRHPNIKLFISQGGIQSLEETIFSHVPVLIMPFFGDQFKNGQLAQSKGFGRILQHKPTLNKDDLESNIRELIDNPSYKATAKRLATLMTDSYMTGREKSIWWIEYVIRNNGTRELRNPSAKLPFYQFYALDVFGFLFAVMLLLISFALFVLRKIAGIFQHSPKKSKKKQN